MASTQSARIEIDALAKVNLYLHITGRRGDGFHELDSLFVRVDSGDRLKLAAADGLNLDIDGPFAPALSAKEVGDNLVLTAARRLACHLDREPGAAIHLQKNLPVAAGLGGGSADAASTLLGLRMLWRAEIPDDRLRAIAAELGADVPACLAHHPLQVAGIGERLVPAPDLPPAWLVLVNPGIELSTADVFRRFAGGFSRAMPLDGAPANVETLADVLRARRNDLEPAAMGLVPEIADVLATLSGEPPHVACPHVRQRRHLFWPGSDGGWRGGGGVANSKSPTGLVG